MNYSREREQHDNRGKHDDKRNYDSGAERIRSQNRYFNARYTPSCHHHHHMCDDHYYPRDRSSSQNRPSVNYTPFRQRQFSQEHNRYHTSRDFSNKQHMLQNSPYHNYGKNCSPSPYPPLQPKYSSNGQEHYIIAEKAPKDIHIKVYTQDVQMENRYGPYRLPQLISYLKLMMKRTEIWISLSTNIYLQSLQKEETH
jgi:hypothetical protein